MRGFVASIFILAMVAGAVVGEGWYAAGVRADTYNRLTGSDVTQWEALWVNLRVDCN